MEYKLLEPVVDDPSLRGDQMPRLWTAPPRHIEVDGTCPSCGGVQKVRPGTGCGDYLSADILDWAKGIGYDLDPWQKWTLTQGLGVKPDGKWSSFENTLVISRQNGKGTILEVRELAGLFVLSEKLIIHTAHELKGLADDTPVLTHNRGWETMGELKEGDFVYAPDGSPALVSATAHHTDKKCYKVTFADGQQVVADSDHRWEVTEAWLYNGKTERKVVTTEQMFDAGLVHESGPSCNSRARRVYRWRTDIPHPVQMPEAELPVHPWLLGAWLGDGTSARGSLTVGQQDLEFVLSRIQELEEKTTTVSEGRPGVWTVRIEGLTSRLRKLGVLGNKHIPELYATASVSQRRELITGIMDTDGTVSGHQLVVSMMSERLIAEVLPVVRSLGYRATIGTHQAKLNGKVTGIVHTVRFAPNGVSPFSMPRKTAKISNLKHNRSEYNAIVSIEPVETVSTSCITVEHPSHCYLAGKGFFVTHNTAQEHFLRVRETIENNPSLSRRLKGRPRLTNGQEAIELKPLPTLIFGPGGKRVRKRVASRLKFLARSKGSARGFTCDCLIYDEAMILGTEAVGASLPTMAAVPNPQIWFTGSAGLEDSFQLARSRDRIVRDTKDLFGAEWSGVAHLETCPRDMINGRRANDYIVCDKHDDRDDPRTWAKANPAYGYRLTGDYIRKAELAIMVPVEFDRERNGIGQWPREEAAWKVVSEDLWETLTIPIRNAERGKQMALAVDIDPDGRSATIAASWAHTNGKQIVMSIPNGASRQGTAWVLQRLIQLDRKFKPIAIVVPRSGPAAGLGNDLEKMWPDNPKWKTKLIRATVSDEAAAFAWFKQQCHDRSKPLVHAPEEQVPTMYSALGNAETRVVGDGGMAFSRRDSEQDITPITAASLSAWGLNKKLKKYDPVNSVA